MNNINVSPVSIIPESIWSNILLEWMDPDLMAKLAQVSKFFRKIFSNENLWKSKIKEYHIYPIPEENPKKNLIKIVADFNQAFRDLNDKMGASNSPWLFFLENRKEHLQQFPPKDIENMLKNVALGQMVESCSLVQDPKRFLARVKAGVIATGTAIDEAYINSIIKLCPLRGDCKEFQRVKLQFLKTILDLSGKPSAKNLGYAILSTGNGNSDVIQLLLERGATLDKETREVLSKASLSMELMLDAAQKQNYAIMEFLYSLGYHTPKEAPQKKENKFYKNLKEKFTSNKCKEQSRIKELQATLAFIKNELQNEVKKISSLQTSPEERLALYNRLILAIENDLNE